MVNKSAVFAKAWADYRIRRLGIYMPGDEAGRRFYRPLFAKCLRSAWDVARTETLRREVLIPAVVVAPSICSRQ